MKKDNLKRDAIVVLLFTLAAVTLFFIALFSPSWRSQSYNKSMPATYGLRKQCGRDGSDNCEPLSCKDFENDFSHDPRVYHYCIRLLNVSWYLYVATWISVFLLLLQLTLLPLSAVLMRTLTDRVLIIVIIICVILDFVAPFVYIFPYRSFVHALGEEGKTNHLGVGYYLSVSGDVLGVLAALCAASTALRLRTGGRQRAYMRLDKELII